jgi:hypothetical protein
MKPRKLAYYDYSECTLIGAHLQPVKPCPLKHLVKDRPNVFLAEPIFSPLIVEDVVEDNRLKRITKAHSERI